ncbi:TRAG protein [Acetobacter pomorum]|nr:TRAG protein [Acetobacter pomorum]
MQGQPLDILGQGILLGENGRSGLAHDAGHGGGLRQFLLLHQQFERAKAPSAGRDFVSAGLGPFAIKHGTDIQALQQPATLDVAGQFLDRQAGLYPPHVGLRQHQPVERDVAGRTQADFGNSGRHCEKLHDGRIGDSPLPSQPVTKIRAALCL